MAPTPLPVDESDAVDHGRLARNVERWAQTTLSGYVVGSAGGEERYTSEADLLAAVRTVAGARREDQLVIGGVDTPSTTEALRLAESMAAAGADMVRVRIPQTPSGNSRGNVVAYFEEITSHSPLPLVVIHQTWQTGGHAATPEEIGQITSLDQVVAYVCWHDIRFESYVRMFVPDTVGFWAPNGSLVLSCALIGADGVCAFFANWAPELIAEIMRRGLRGDYAAAQSLQRRVLHADFLGMTYGVRALKAGLELLGYEATVPRRPVPPLGAAETEELAAALRETGVLT